MKRISKLFLIIILFYPLAGGQPLFAQDLKPDNIDSLIVKQFSINGDADYEGTRGNQLTFHLLLDSTGGLDAGQLLAWIEEKIVVVEGMRPILQQAVVKNSRILIVPFEFEKPLSAEYLETTLHIAGTAQYAAAEAGISLFRGVNSVVRITSSGSMFRTNHKAVIPENFPYAGQQTRQELLTYAVLPAGETLNEHSSSYLFRNRYWLVGAATLAASGAAMMLNTGDSVTYLPEPPGRP